MLSLANCPWQEGSVNQRLMRQIGTHPAWGGSFSRKLKPGYFPVSSRFFPLLLPGPIWYFSLFVSFSSRFLYWSLSRFLPVLKRGLESRSFCFAKSCNRFCVSGSEEVTSFGKQKRLPLSLGSKTCLWVWFQPPPPPIAAGKKALHWKTPHWIMPPQEETSGGWIL